jgi:hypothetical protein
VANNSGDDRTISTFAAHEAQGDQQRPDDVERSADRQINVMKRASVEQRVEASGALVIVIC